MNLRQNKPKQLTLALNHEPAFSRDDFLVFPGNRGAFDYVTSWPRWSAPVTLLAGPPRSGKTHLASIWAKQAGAAHVSGPAIEQIDGHEAMLREGPVCVEDVDVAPPSDASLFHFLNAARVAGKPVLLTARAAPGNWERALPDLMSRLKAATPVAIDELDDEALRRLLVKLAADRDLKLDPHILDYVTRRMTRSYAAAAALVDELDLQALAEKRPVTRAVAANALDALDRADG